MGAQQSKYKASVSAVIPELEVPVQLIHKHHITMNQAQQVELAKNLNGLLTHVGDWLLKEFSLKQGKQTAFLLRFENHFNLSEHAKWIQVLVDLVNVHLRRASGGYLFGIGNYKLTDKNQIECILAPNELLLLDREVLTSDALEEMTQQYLELIVHTCETGKMTTVFYDPAVVSPDQMDQMLLYTTQGLSSVNPNLRALWLHERSTHFSFTLLVYEDQEDVDLQQFLFAHNYDEVFLALINAKSAQQTSADGFFNYHLTQQMLPFFSLVFLLKYQFQIWLSSTDTSVYLDTIQFQLISENQLLKLHYLYAQLVGNLSQQQRQQLEELCGSEVDIFSEELRTEQTSGDSQNKTQTVEEAQMSSAVQLIVGELLQQYLEAQEFKRLSLNTDYFNQEELAERRDEIAAALQQQMRAGDSLVVTTNEEDVLTWEVLRGSAVKRRRKNLE